jgi:hypothetical protein
MHPAPRNGLHLLNDQPASEPLHRGSGRARHALLSLSLSLSLWVALAGGVGGCDQPSGTGGQAIQFTVVVRGAPQEGKPLGALTTRTGWEVTLEEAYITIGPLYLYENAPAQVAALAQQPAPGGASWLRALWLPSAYAHAGDQHFSGGRVMGEALQQHVIDLLDPAGVTLTRSRGVEGRAQSLSVWLLPPKASAVGPTESLRGYTAYVVGVARRDDQEVRFAGGLSIPDEESMRLVAGVPVNIPLTDGAQALIEVHPDAWFTDAHFDRLTEVTSGDRALIGPDTQPYNAWLIGARGAWAFSASPQ